MATLTEEAGTHAQFVYPCDFLSFLSLVSIILSLFKFSDFVPVGKKSYSIKPTFLSSVVGLISDGDDTACTLEVENLLLKNKLTLKILKTKELRFYFMQ